MGIKYEWRTVAEIESASEGLLKAGENFALILQQMRQNGMDKVLLTWAQRHWDAYDVITTAAAYCVGLMPAQIDAKRQNRMSKYEKAVSQSKKDAETRRSKTPAAPPKKRGRPPKKKGA